MNTYPRDEFDDVDENSSRQGAYRGRITDTSTSRAGLLAIIISGVLALLVGGIMYVVSPRTAGPGAVAASATATATATASTEASPTTNPASVTVAVYNSSAPEGSASTVASILKKANYKVTETTNWAGAYTSESMVYFATGSSSEANEIADKLGIPYINQDFQAETGEVYVVLGADFDPVALAGQIPTSSGNITPTPSAVPSSGVTVETGAGNSVQRYSFDPATGTYGLDPAGAYIYDAATGTYHQG